jgi:DNA polymerase elongation subunit (family B)
MPIIFQALDILPRDEFIMSENDDECEVAYASEEEYEDDDEDAIKRKRRARAYAQNRSSLLIHIFGRTNDGQNIQIDVEGFKPFFYIEAPSDLSVHNLKIAQKQLAEFIQKQVAFARYMKIDLEFREKFYGFTNHRSFPFFKLTVQSQQNFSQLRRCFLNEENRPTIKFPIGSCWGRQAPAVYESNLDPMLRFLHTQNLSPCGWMQIPYDEVPDGSIRVNYQEVTPANAPAAAAPFKTVSWDIECFSSSGDFPLAKKNYRKVAKDLYALALDGKHAVELIEGAIAWNGHATGTMAGMAPIICRCRLPPDARRVFQAGMYKEKIYKEIERYLKTSSFVKEDAIEKLTSTLNNLMGTRFPIAGDPIIQVGAVVSVNNVVQERHIFVYPGCEPIEGAHVHVAEDEESMLVKWFQWMELVDPDILIGYNVFGFDEKYVWERCEELNLTDDGSLQAFNRLCNDGGVMKCEESFLSSSALGDNYLYMWTTQGRLQVDLYHYIRRMTPLDSYKLDDVAMYYMSGPVLSCEPAIAGQAKLTIKGAVKDVRAGRAFKLLDEAGDGLTGKLEVVAIEGNVVTLNVATIEPDEWLGIAQEAEKWVIVKDDVSPAELFKLHCGDDADRAKIARYCIQDCDLVLELYKKLEVFMNAMAMANVCSVPVRYIFTRGQGIKIESLIAKECLGLNKCIVTLPAPNRQGTETSYEGAIVLDPIPGFYSRSPIGVADFASLYPSTIVSENISHDTLVWTKDYDADGYLIKHSWGTNEYDLLDDVPYTDIKFDLLINDPEDKTKNPKKIKAGVRICRYAQDEAGTLPIIINKLLAARKAKRKEEAAETDPLRKILLDTEQLAYKLTANSLYGQLGSGTFKMRLQDLAASTTAYGRLQIMFAKAVIERFYGPASGRKDCCANIMYGDTDSLFVEFNPRNPETGERITGREGRQAVIDLTAEAGHLVTHALKPPHDFEFDKVFDPMLIFSKKRYAGKMFESNADEFVYKYMGIALKRRGNAPIVKKIYGGAMKMILDSNDVAGATTFVQEQSMALVEGKISMGMLAISKALKADYADPQRIAHKVLADRIMLRDPGNAPAAGDRISYVFIKPAAGQVASKLQGDRIETPAYVKEKGLALDGPYYIDHQISKPVAQMFGVMLELMPGFQQGMLPPNYDEMSMELQIAVRERVATALLFDAALQRASVLDKRRFMTKMFGLSTGVTTAPVATTGKTTKNTIRAPLEPPKKQSRLTNYFQNKELLNKIKSSPTSSKSGSSDEESIKSETTTVTSESSVRKRKTKIIKG